jgi:membrane-associated phospholipid phosphatase
MSRALVILVAAGLAGLLALALAHEHDPVEAIDLETARWVARSLPTSVEWAARPFSWLGGWLGLTVLGAAAAVLLARERAWIDLAFLLAAFAGSQLVTQMLKDLIGRLRPEFGSAVPLPSSFAFPSGHAAAGAASLGALAVLLSERLPPGRARTWLWIGVVALGTGVGLSRIALNVHYVSDVMAGWCLGIAWLAACLLVRDRLLDRERDRA